MASAVAKMAAARPGPAQGTGVLQAIWADAGEPTGEVTTQEVRQILADGSATVVDTRSTAEFAAGHLPGARNIATRADGPAEQYVEAVERLVGGNKATALVLYCNGPFCKRTRSLGRHLVAAGYSDVRRYQLGIPVWRALGGPTEIELNGVLRVYRNDRTAVFFDARTPEEFARGSLLGAHNVPADGTPEEIAKAPLPRDDFNSRVVVFGHDRAQARKLADVLSTTPFHNVLYFPGSHEALAEAIGKGTRTAANRTT
jgi:rhodanese-related sulfurtransferase